MGMKQLNLGLSIFEIKKLMKIMDIEGNDSIKKTEFINALMYSKIYKYILFTNQKIGLNIKPSMWIL